MLDLVLTGATVMTPQGPVEADVGIDGSRVAAVGRGLVGGDTLDCSGTWLGPGFVDLHVHLREPGQEWKEDIASGSAAAAAGGYTAVVAMANTTPAIDSGHLARLVREQGNATGLVEVVPAGAITMERAGTRLAHLDELWAAGVRIFSDDGDVVADAGLLRRAMDYLAPLRGIIAMHALDPHLGAGHMHEGEVSSLLGMAAIPAEAEEVIVSRDLALVRLTGASYHLQHVSTAGSVELVRAAKTAGLKVTAEVTPHHLSFDHHEVKRTDPAYKMRPPLRGPEDVAALRAALVDGTIDAVATDHAPHADYEEEVPFEEAPFGVIGLETAAPAVLAATGIGPELLFQRMSLSPARIAGLEQQGRLVAPGAPANLVAFDPTIAWTPTSFRSKARNSPYLGRELRGRARYTLFQGRPTWENR